MIRTCPNRPSGLSPDIYIYLLESKDATNEPRVYAGLEDRDDLSQISNELNKTNLTVRIKIDYYMNWYLKKTFSNNWMPQFILHTQAAFNSQNTLCQQVRSLSNRRALWPLPILTNWTTLRPPDHQTHCASYVSLSLYTANKSQLYRICIYTVYCGLCFTPWNNLIYICNAHFVFKLNIYILTIDNCHPLPTHIGRRPPNAINAAAAAVAARTCQLVLLVRVN